MECLLVNMASLLVLLNLLISFSFLLYNKHTNAYLLYTKNELMKCVQKAINLIFSQHVVLLYHHPHCQFDILSSCVRRFQMCTSISNGVCARTGPVRAQTRARNATCTLRRAHCCGLGPQVGPTIGCYVRWGQRLRRKKLLQGLIRRLGKPLLTKL